MWCYNIMTSNGINLAKHFNPFLLHLALIVFPLCCEWPAPVGHDLLVEGRLGLVFEGGSYKKKCAFAELASYSSLQVSLCKPPVQTTPQRSEHTSGVLLYQIFASLVSAKVTPSIILWLSRISEEGTLMMDFLRLSGKSLPRGNNPVWSLIALNDIVAK